jgi:nicotinate phosphoribosyltransferase
VCKGRPLLEPVMRAGRRVRPREPLEVARARRQAAVRGLPARLSALDPADEPYEVRLSAGLEALVQTQRERQR